MGYIRAIIGWPLVVSGGLGNVVFGLWGFVLALAIVIHVMGFWGAVIGVVLFPITYSIAPLYAGIEYGNWFPAVVCYGGEFGSVLVLGIGLAIKGDQT